MNAPRDVTLRASIYCLYLQYISGLTDMPSLLERWLAFVDLKTTGGSATRDGGRAPRGDASRNPSAGLDYPVPGILHGEKHAQRIGAKFVTHVGVDPFQYLLIATHHSDLDLAI